MADPVAATPPTPPASDGSAQAALDAAKAGAAAEGGAAEAVEAPPAAAATVTDEEFWVDHKVTIQSHSYSERQCCCALGVAVVGAWWAADPARCFVWQAWIDSVNADKLEVKVPQNHTTPPNCDHAALYLRKSSHMQVTDPESRGGWGRSYTVYRVVTSPKGLIVWRRFRCVVCARGQAWFLRAFSLGC